MIVVYIYILFYSFFKTFFHRKRNQIAVRSRFDESVRRFRERSLHARKRKRFPSFCVTFIHENHPSDIIIINMFSISATAVVVSASSANKVRFCFCRSLSVFLFAFFAFFARGLKVCGGCVSLSLSRRLIFPRRRTPIPGGKSLDRHRAIFHTPLPLLPSRRVSSRWRQRRVSFPPLVFSLLSK